MRLFFALALVASTAPPVAIRLLPHTLMVGATVRITCKVQRDASNRMLTWGIGDYVTSDRPLEGESARVTWQWDVPHIPCDVGPAFCIVTKNDGTRQGITEQMEIVGCDGPTVH